MMQSFGPFLLMLHLQHVTSHHLSDVTTRELTASVRDVFETFLQAEAMQEYLDGLNYVIEDQDDDAVTKLSMKLESKLGEVVGVVERLKDKILASYVENSTSRDMPECCSITITRRDKRFRAPVDDTTACYRENSLLSNKVSTTAVNTLTEVFIGNLLQVPSLKWQYFSSENGLDILYPSYNTMNCDGDTSRFRPWYIQAISSKPKRVVVLIDKSRSMATIHNGVSRLTSAQQAAKYVVSSLGPLDKFAVLAYSTTLEVFRPSEKGDNCYASRLASATPLNTRTVGNYIDQIKAEGGARYGRALSKAFELQINDDRTSNLTEVDRVILFISDGSPDDTASGILNTVAILGGRINNSVIIMTYGIGNEDFSILKDISAYNPDITKRGEFVAVPDPAKLPLQMVLFHKFLYSKEQITPRPFWTAPYFDNLGVGQIVTLSYPIVMNNRFIGVVGADMRLDNIMSPSKNFKRNRFSYPFVISNTGLLYDHPYHLYSDKNETLYAFATALERDKEFLPVFESMKRLETGDTVISKTTFLNYNDFLSYSGNNTPVLTHYKWTDIPGTAFSCCLVVSLEHVTFALSTASSLPAGAFLYHEFHLIPPEATCAHVHLLAAQNRSSLILAVRALNVTDGSKIRNFTRDDIMSIGRYMEGTGPNTFHLTDAVKEDVVATYKAESLWTTDDRANTFEMQTLWRYIGTENGIFRIYPGIELPSRFDPVTRPWYRKGFIQYNRFIITLPDTNDLVDKAPVVTIARAIHKKRPEIKSGLNTSANTFGVMGVDISLRYFNDIIARFYSTLGLDEELSSFILDDEGGVVLADSYLENLKLENNVLGVRHITVMEPELSSVLIREGILRHNRCSDIERGVLLRKYTLSISEDNVFKGSFRTPEDGCYLFVVAPVPETNAFLLIKNNTDSDCPGQTIKANTACICLSKFLHVLLSCSTSWGSGDLCECPCYDRSPYFDACQSMYSDITSDTPPPCSSLPWRTPMSNFEGEEDVSNLVKCYDTFLNAPVVFSLLTGAIVGIAIFGGLITFSASLMYFSYTQKRDAKKQRAIRSVTKSYFREQAKSFGDAFATNPSKISPSRATSCTSHTQSTPKKGSNEQYDTNEIVETLIQMSFHRTELSETSSKTTTDVNDKETNSTELIEYFSADTQKYLSEIESTYSKRLTNTTSSPLQTDSNLNVSKKSPTTLGYSASSKSTSNQPIKSHNEASYFS